MPVKMTILTWKIIYFPNFFLKIGCVCPFEVLVPHRGDSNMQSIFKENIKTKVKHGHDYQERVLPILYS